MKTLQERLVPLKIGKKRTYRNLTVFPLLGSVDGDPGYLILEKALGEELIEITEVDAGGSVSELRLINRGEQPVLILEGEELVGAKQNRVVNATMLIPGKSEWVVPVSCVEEGRWHSKSRAFSVSRNLMPAGIKREHQQRMRARAGGRGGFRSDQQEIWNQVAQRFDRFRVHSPTRAMEELFHKTEAGLSEYCRAFRWMECQSGAVFGINGRLEGMECFAYARTYAAYFEKLLRSYAIDALDRQNEPQGTSIPPETARRFLARVLRAECTTHRAVGLGRHIHIETRSLSGVGLSHNHKVLHLAVFRKERSAAWKSGTIRRFSSRRNRNR